MNDEKLSVSQETVEETPEELCEVTSPAEEIPPETAEEAVSQREEVPGTEELTQEAPAAETETDGEEQPAPGIEERLAALEKRFEEREAALEKRERELSLREHFASLQRQAKDLSQELPGFSLEKELEDPEFLRLTSPEIGLGVEAAYYALHHAGLQAEAYERAAKAVSESVRAGAYLPRENGAASAGSPPSPSGSWRDMSPEERAARKKLILSGYRF